MLKNIKDPIKIVQKLWRKMIHTKGIIILNRHKKTISDYFFLMKTNNSRNAKTSFSDTDVGAIFLFYWGSYVLTQRLLTLTFLALTFADSDNYITWKNISI